MTGMFTLTIRAEGSAFTGPGEPHLEISRLLRVVQQRLLDGDTEGKCMDVNGVSCGTWALAEPEYRFRLVYDPSGVDVGDWLPQDREHYERVGPFTLDGKDATWDEWRADPSSRVENWVSYVLFLDRKDPGQTWVNGVSALGGMDYCTIGDHYDNDPGEGTWDSIEELPDSHLREVAKDLLNEETSPS